MAVQKLHDLSGTALIDMGDFVGGMLKYAKRHPVPRITIAGGFAKMTKLGQGLLDLHSKSGSVDRAWLSELLREAEAPADLIELCRDANTALLVLREAEKRGIPIGQFVAKAAWKTAAQVLDGSHIALDIAVFDREGHIVGRWG
jgi:cobalt-precorrin-5B (C1)-methyltransferase